jgi:ethanolamine ammonia-lyase small subunit
MSNDPVHAAWTKLKQFTPARVALGQAGNSLPTRELLDFGMAHAKARDAVHASFHLEQLTSEMRQLGFDPIVLNSAAWDRAEYLRRPDLGRRLDGQSRKQLQDLKIEKNLDLVFVVADGLSALASERYAAKLLLELQQRMSGWRIGPLIIATQARVAIGDEIGALLGARIVAVLIGERPGLSAPDSLGVYITYNPSIGRSDAERNCISNIRTGGLTDKVAAHRLFQLLQSALRLQLSGVALKDESDEMAAHLLPE